MTGLIRLRRKTNYECLKKSKKVKFSLCLTEHYAINVYEGVDIFLHLFFNVGIGWSLVILRPFRFNPGARDHGSPFIGVRNPEGRRERFAAACRKQNLSRTLLPGYTASHSKSNSLLNKNSS